MHANLEQLLEIKDGIENSASNHVKDCLRCRAEMESIMAIADQIETSAEHQPPADMWQRIERSVVHNSEPLGFAPTPEAVPEELLYAATPSRWNSLTAAVYTLAFSVLATGLLSFYGGNQPVDSAIVDSGVVQNEFLQANVSELMLNSRGLERVLQRASIQDALLTNEERNLVDRLHFRLTYVDQMIQENNITDESDPDREETLWNERIDTLTELNQLYYQTQYALADSDI